MEILLPHRVEYLVEGHVPVGDIIDSLQAQQRVVVVFGDLLEEILDGVTVQKAELRVRSIDSGSLKEAFFVALFLVYQEDLKKDVPAMLEKWLGVRVDENYDTLVTVGVLLILFYGADYAYRRFTDQLGSDRIRKQLDYFISELSQLSGKPEAEVTRIIDGYFKKPGKVKETAKAAIRFFRASRNKKNEPIVVGDKRIETDVVREVPNQVNLADLDKNDHSVPLHGVRIELRAKDQDHEGQGWGGIVYSVSSKRQPVKLYPHVPKDVLWKHDTVWADVLVTYRTTGDRQEPIRYHIIKIRDDLGPIAPSNEPSDNQSPQGTQ